MATEQEELWSQVKDLNHKLLFARTETERRELFRRIRLLNERIKALKAAGKW